MIYDKVSVKLAFNQRSDPICF